MEKNKAMLEALHSILEKSNDVDEKAFEIIDQLHKTFVATTCHLHHQCLHNNIFAKSDNVVFEWTIKEDIPTNYVSDNISVFGYEPDDFYQGHLRDYWEFVHPEDRDKVRDSLYLARQAPIAEYKHRYRVVDANARTRWVEEWVLFERNQHGDLMSEKGILKDVSEIMAISQRLEESEQKYRDLFEHANAIMVVFDQEGVVTNVNRSFEVEFGLSRYDVIRKQLNSFNEIIDYQQLLDYPEGEISIEIHGENRYYHYSTRIINHPERDVEIQVIANNITTQKCAENEIRYLTEHDKLTGVYSRSYFEAKMSELAKDSFGMIVGDVNALKVTNDAFGHKTGDMILIMIAEILKTCCREGDVIARLSGDEFAIISMSTDDSYYQNLMTSIHQQCSRIELLPIKPNISLGYAIRKSELEPKEMVFKRADENMYVAKRRESMYIKQKMIDTILNRLFEDLDFMANELAEKERLAKAIAIDLSFSQEMTDALLMTVKYHDVGNVSIRRGVFYKRQSLTNDEYANIRKHAEVGYHILLAVPEYAQIAEYVLYHHEWWNGKGYPQGLSGNSIPVISRIISVIDAYVAMKNHRTYQEQFTETEAKARLLEMAGMQFDPRIVKSLLSICTKPSVD